MSRGVGETVWEVVAVFFDVFEWYNKHYTIDLET